jgi:hypothetical protein
VPYPKPKPPAGGVKADYPGFIPPALATLVDKVPSGERWIHKIKFNKFLRWDRSVLNIWIPPTIRVGTVRKPVPRLQLTCREREPARRMGIAKRYPSVVGV